MKKFIDDVRCTFGTGDCPHCGQPVIDMKPYPDWYRFQDYDKYLERQTHWWNKKAWAQEREEELLKQQKEE